MDQRYISVKVAAMRLADIGLQQSSFLKLEVKLFRLQTAILKRALTPRLQVDDSAFDYLTLLVEEIALAPRSRSKCEAISEHLEMIIAAVEAEPLEMS